MEYIAGEILVMKKGVLIHSGKPNEIIRSVGGKVWECRVPAALAGEISESFDVINLRNEGEETVLRLLSDKLPMPEARKAVPNLEDLYMYYFNDEEEGRKNHVGTDKI